MIYDTLRICLQNIRLQIGYNTVLPRLSTIIRSKIMFDNRINAARLDSANCLAVFGIPQQSFTHVLFC